MRGDVCDLLRSVLFGCSFEDLSLMPTRRVFTGSLGIALRRRVVRVVVSRVGFLSRVLPSPDSGP